MNVRSAPVAIFDSGMGGLSVLREVRRVLPAESLLYVADSRYCPYGDRSPDEIRERTFAIGDAIAELGARLLIVACNTACSVALGDLRARLMIPIVGLEPAIKPAVQQTRTGEIAVLATPRTAAGERLAGLIDRYATGVTVHVVVGRGLVEFVEAGEFKGLAVESSLRLVLSPLAGRAIDVLVLGCTHYPFLADAIGGILGPRVRLIDSGAAIASRACQLLPDLDEPDPRSIGTLQMLTTGDPVHVGGIASRLLGQPITANRLDC